MIPGPPTLRTLLLSSRQPRVGRKRLVDYQNKQLHLLVRHAYQNVPYYRKLFECHGLKPDDIRTVEDLSAIPITSKKDLQLLPAKEIVASGVDPNRLLGYSTSGCTGEPFTIRRTWIEDRILGAYQKRARRYFGQRGLDKKVYLNAATASPGRLA